MKQYLMTLTVSLMKALFQWVIIIWQPRKHLVKITTP